MKHPTDSNRALLRELAVFPKIIMGSGRVRETGKGEREALFSVEAEAPWRARVIPRVSLSSSSPHVCFHMV